MGRVLSLFLALFLTFLSCGRSSSSGGRKVGVDASWYPLNLDQQERNVTAFSTELLGQIGTLEKIPFVKVTVNWDTLMEGLQKNQYEAILTSMPPYIFNEKLFDFSAVYLPLGPVLIVPLNSTIHSLDTLDGKEIAVIAGSTNTVILEKSAGVLIRDYDSIPKALNDVAAGTIDGAMIDILPAAAYCRDLYQGVLKIATPPLTDEGLRLVTKRGTAPDLIKGFNKGLNKLKKNGSYDKLLDRWSLQGTKERRKIGKAVAKIHERIKNQRKDFCHKETRKIVDQYQYICIEDLDIKHMMESSHFAKSIVDASWNQFRQFLTYKAAEAGRKLGMVNPAYTSQICSQCGHLEPKKLTDREHKCSQCGYTAHRDFNAAQNILALGLNGLGATPRSPHL
jgi:polar amino acid transport system substrate-binding protein